MKIISIDQGSSKCGWALFDNDAYVDSGAFKLKGKDRMERYAHLLELLTEVCVDNNVRVMVIEDVFTKRSGFANPKTSKIMGETRGVIISVGLTYNMEIINVNPAELTKYLHINTRVDDKKKVTQAYVAKMIGRDPTEDEADAVLIGLIALSKKA